MNTDTSKQASEQSSNNTIIEKPNINDIYNILVRILSKYINSSNFQIIGMIENGINIILNPNRKPNDVTIICSIIENPVDKTRVCDLMSLITNLTVPSNILFDIREGIIKRTVNDIIKKNPGVTPLVDNNYLESCLMGSIMSCLYDNSKLASLKQNITDPFDFHLIHWVLYHYYISKKEVEQPMVMDDTPVTIEQSLPVKDENELAMIELKNKLNDRLKLYPSFIMKFPELTIQEDPKLMQILIKYIEKVPSEIKRFTVRFLLNNPDIPRIAIKCMNFKNLHLFPVEVRNTDPEYYYGNVIENDWYSIEYVPRDILIKYPKLLLAAVTKNDEAFNFVCDINSIWNTTS